MKQQLQGKIAIETGWGRDLEKAIAESYAEQGATVIVTI